MPRIVNIVSKSPKPKQKKRVAAYVRVSTGKDAMLHSLSAQISYYNDFIQSRNDWLFVGVYADEAKTGTKDTRDEFKRLVDDCRNGKIDMIITKSISRFARNTVTLLQTVRELKAMGIDVYFEEQNIHTISSDGELMLTILASYAQEESRSASENQKWRIKRNFEEGIPWRGAMLGYRLKDGKYEIVAEEAEMVRRIYDEYLKGESQQTIAEMLNKDGVPSYLGKQWSLLVIYKILSNYSYTGNLILQKTFRENHLTKRTLINNGEVPKYHVENAHEAIIDIDTFKAVQAEKSKRKARFVKNPAPKKTYPFTGLLICGNCGKKYRHRVTKTRAFWICRTFYSHGKSACASKQIPEETLEKVTAEVLGQSDFSEEEMRNRIQNILVCNGNLLVFHLTDGSEVLREWKDRSRSQSWTDEMKAAARQREMERRNSHA